MQKMTRIDLITELKSAKSVGITGHIRPDGDCVGSTMALYLYIKKNLPEIDTHIYLEKPPAIYDCIKDIDRVEDASLCDREFDVFIVADVTVTGDRTGEAKKLIDKSKKVINIDHHITNKDGSGDVNYVIPEASSACELVYDCFEEELIDVEIAKALYIGVIHDTGVLQYSNVSKKTLELAGKLITYGFDFSKLIDETFYQKTFLQTKLLGKVLSECVLFLDGRVSAGHLSFEDMQENHATSEDMDGIVNQLRFVKGADVAVFMYGIKEGTYKVSLRSSTDDVDVSKVCALFGGGGHKRAAGVTLEGTFEEIMTKLVNEIEKQYA